MTKGLEELGELLAGPRWQPAEVSDGEIGAQIRQSLACVGFGSLSELSSLPSYARGHFGGVAGSWSEVQARAFGLTTLGAASDLDPLDRGPAHLALPATIAVLLAADDLGRRVDNVTVEDAVAHGVEVAGRLRAAARHSRPGVGFHSGGSFGLLSAAASVTRLLALDSAQATEALAIAFTRISGLAVNSAQTAIGLTHFGYGAAHGLEAALLAREGWRASHNIDAIYNTLFATDYTPAYPGIEAPVICSLKPAFKMYPCNIYINLAILALLRMAEPGTANGGSPIKIIMPVIPHLNNAAPVNIRELRNSMQGAIAVAMRFGLSYMSFTEGLVDLPRDVALQAEIANVAVEQDPAIPTALSTTRVEVTLDGRTESCTVEDLHSWDESHVEQLTEGLDPTATSWVKLVRQNEYLEGFASVLAATNERDNT